MSAIDRRNAEGQLQSAGFARHPDRAQARALTGIGWALLDLANAIREGVCNGERTSPDDD